jgi:FixJ family two-component response regulator
MREPKRLIRPPEVAARGSGPSSAGAASAPASQAPLEAAPVVFILDDDISIRESLWHLVEAAGWHPEAYASAQTFLQRPRQVGPSCLILDVGLPDLSGLEVQQRLAGGQGEMPIIFITGSGDVRTTVQALKAGAVEFLTKPLSSPALLQAVHGALARSRRFLQEQQALQSLRNSYQSLSRREQQVMGLVVQGYLNKEVAGALGISEITVKSHRGRLMRKMRINSLAELVIVAIQLGLQSADTGHGVTHEH